MPICASVRRTGRGDVSTVRMISSFSEAAISHARSSPSRDHAFFEQAVLERHLGQRLFELTGLGTQTLDLVGGRLAGGVAGEAALAGLQELLRPAIVHALSDAFLAA